jgi:hypothetical protein
MTKTKISIPVLRNVLVKVWKYCMAKVVKYYILLIIYRKGCEMLKLGFNCREINRVLEWY